MSASRSIRLASSGRTGPETSESVSFSCRDKGAASLLRRCPKGTTRPWRRADCCPSSSLSLGVNLRCHTRLDEVANRTCAVRRFVYMLDLQRDCTKKQLVRCRKLCIRSSSFTLLIALSEASCIQIFVCSFWTGQNCLLHCARLSFCAVACSEATFKCQKSSILFVICTFSLHKARRLICWHLLVCGSFLCEELINA